jgi:hypothetical protein
MILPRDERARQIAVAAAILLGLAVLVCTALLGWRRVPGVTGEWLGFVIGVMTSPFLMEASFAVLGITLVVAINCWRRERAGDELVYLEQVNDPPDLPEHASWAVFKDEPLEVELPTLLVQAEGAMAIGDYEAAAECLAAMTEEELQMSETLDLRLQLARLTGHNELASQLEEQMRVAGRSPDI